MRQVEGGTAYGRACFDSAGGAGSMSIASAKGVVACAFRPPSSVSEVSYTVAGSGVAVSCTLPD